MKLLDTRTECKTVVKEFELEYIAWLVEVKGGLTGVSVKR